MQLVGKLRGNVFHRFDAFHIFQQLDFRQQDNWLDVIVQEREVKFDHLFDELYDSQVVNDADLLISNKKYEFIQSPGNHLQKFITLFTFLKK